MQVGGKQAASRTWQAVQQRQLQALGEACGEALHVQLRRVPALWLQEDLHTHSCSARPPRASCACLMRDMMARQCRRGALSAAEQIWVVAAACSRCRCCGWDKLTAACIASGAARDARQARRPPSNSMGLMAALPPVPHAVTTCTCRALPQACTHGLHLPHLVAVLVRKAHDLVLDGWAVAWARCVHPAAILGRLCQVVPDDAVRGLRGAREVAAHLRPLHVHLCARRQAGRGALPPEQASAGRTAACACTGHR